MSLHYMNRKSNNATKNVHYTCKFWCVVSIFITLICILLVMFILSIKAVIQFAQIQFYDNSVRGTVTVAEYRGKTPVDEYSYKYENCHYIIEFDKEVSGYDKYEYAVTNMITTEKYIGDRYIVLFNRIENPVLIQEEDVVIDGLILITFIFIVLMGLLFRKQIKRLAMKMQG